MFSLSWGPRYKFLGPKRRARDLVGIKRKGLQLLQLKEGFDGQVAVIGATCRLSLVTHVANLQGQMQAAEPAQRDILRARQNPARGTRELKL